MDFFCDLIATHNFFGGTNKITECLIRSKVTFDDSLCDNIFARAYIECYVHSYVITKYVHGHFYISCHLLGMALTNLCVQKG